MVSEVDVKPLVAEDTLLLSKDWIRELGIEGVNRSGSSHPGNDKGDLNGIVGVG